MNAHSSQAAIAAVQSATVTASGTGTQIIAVSPRASTLALQPVYTAVSGTSPNLTLEVQWSMDGTTYSSADGTADTFTAVTATGSSVKSFTVKGTTARLKWTVTGTNPSFTFSVNALFN